VPTNSTDPFLSTSASGDQSVRLSIDVRRFPWIRRLVADYAYDFPAVAPFFSGNPADRSAWARAIARTQAHERRRTDLASLIASQLRRRGAPAPALEAARSLADSRTVAVVTGQQAGLFGGPLFTLLKAITALKLAREVSQAHDVPAVAVFWIDSEDHDWDEVRVCTVLDDALTPRQVALPPRGPGDAAPVAEVQLDDAVVGALQELESALPPTEFRPALMERLRAIYRPGAGTAEAFGRWLEGVLGDLGLIVYDAADPAGKPLVAGVFARELSAPGETARLAAAAGSALVARGYHSQVDAHDALALFHLERSRRPIRQQNGQFVVGDRHYGPAALLREAAERPVAFSPNVLLRPIVQDALFPTICYVAGPSELAYLGQLREVYEHFGVPMPLMYPRASATILDSGALRFLRKYDVRLEALQPQDESALNALLASQIPPEVDSSLTSAGDTIEKQMARVIEAMPALDPTLEGAAKSTLSRMQQDLQTLRGKVIQAAKRRDETLRRQFSRARALAFPDGKPQERAIGFVFFLNQYGPALIDRLNADLPIDLGRHWVLTI
jgi:bacillithiol biosynthesis cysteine-adding enzyme BshC